MTQEEINWGKRKEDKLDEGRWRGTANTKGL